MKATNLHRTEFDFNGTGERLFVDKPRDWTSFDVVHKVRNLFHIRKIGHAGTLDPLATGLLVLCTGPRTKELNDLTSYDKTYTGRFEIGIETPSYDTETEVTERRAWDHVDEEQVRRTAEQFVGNQRQVPPMYSALKHKGRALYKYARAGKTVERSPRDVVVHSFELVKCELPSVEFTLRCSKGTYVRSLVHDLGIALGTGAVLTELRRESVGPWHVRDAYSLEDLVSLHRENSAQKSIANGPIVRS